MIEAGVAWLERQHADGIGLEVQTGYELLVWRHILLHRSQCG
jgi:hypothetical protein